MRFLVLFFGFLLTPLVANAGPRVDINQDNGRGDVLAPGWISWRVQEKETASARFEGVTAPPTERCTAPTDTRTSNIT